MQRTFTAHSLSVSSNLVDESPYILEKMAIDKGKNLKGKGVDRT